MDAVAVFTLLERGISLLPALLEAGVEITQIIQNLRALATAGKNGSVTEEQLNTLEGQLDTAIAQFNEAMGEPPK